METTDDQKTFGRARLSFANTAEIDEFVTMVGRYERGEITPDQWRAYRLVEGYPFLAGMGVTARNSPLSSQQLRCILKL